MIFTAIEAPVGALLAPPPSRENFQQRGDEITEQLCPTRRDFFFGEEVYAMGIILGIDLLALALDDSVSCVCYCRMIGGELVTCSNCEACENSLRYG